MLFYLQKMTNDRYNQRGVSADKEDVHNAIKNVDKGLFPKAFCKIVPDYLSGDEDYCLIMHADGAGTKSSLAYMYWKETGDLSVWKGIAQDALIMNIDDLLQYYSPGKPKMKPDVLEEIIKIEEKRRKHAEAMINKGQVSKEGTVMIQQEGKDPIALNNTEIVNLMKQQQQQLQQQDIQLKQIKQAYEQLANENIALKKQLEKQNENIEQLQKLNTKLLLDTYNEKNKSTTNEK